MPIPYSTTPSGTMWPQSAYGPDGVRMPWGLEPADGSFEYPKGVTSYFEQTAVGKPTFWQMYGSVARFPYAVAGDYCLGIVPVEAIPPGNPDDQVPSWCPSQTGPANYTVTATVQFTGKSQSAGVIGRYYRPTTSPIQYFQGYRFMVSQSGSWTLYLYQLAPTNKAGSPPALLASGKLAPLGVGTSHTISLMVNGPNLTPSVDGHALPTTVDGTYAVGVAGIATGGWYPVRFQNVTISP
jgi:hypothetical protein